jgi:hypothetical protein
VSAKRICLVWPNFDAEDLANLRCDDGSHQHLSRRDVWDLECYSEVVWVHRPVNRKDKGVVKISRLHFARGLSCRIGEELVRALASRLAWARVMYADIRPRRVLYE